MTFKDRLLQLLIEADELGLLDDKPTKVSREKFLNSDNDDDMDDFSEQKSKRFVL